MFINTYFPTVIWSEEKPEFVKSLNKASNKYIKEASKQNRKHISKEHGDFGLIIITQRHLQLTMIF